MVCAPCVRRGFFPLDEELGLVAGHFTPSVYEDITRFATWMPFGQAVKETGHFLHITVSEATVRRQSEAVGAAYVAIQSAEVERLECGKNAEVVVGVPQQFMSVDGAFVPLVGGQWAEVKTLAIGTVQAPREVKGERVIQTNELSYFSRLAEATTFQRLALVETQRRGLTVSAAVAAVTDGAEWCQGFIDFHRSDAQRILDFPHAAEYVATIGQTAFAADTAGQKQWLTEQLHQLKHEGPAPVLAAAQKLAKEHPDQVELAKALVAGGNFTFALEHLDGHSGLVVVSGREGLRKLGRNGRVLGDHLGHHAAQGFDTQAQRRHVQQQHVGTVT